MKTETPSEKQTREDEERLMNLNLYNMYVTNEERDRPMSQAEWLAFAILILLLITGGYILHNNLHIKFWNWICS